MQTDVSHTVLFQRRGCLTDLEQALSMYHALAAWPHGLLLTLIFPSSMDLARPCFHPFLYHGFIQVQTVGSGVLP